MKIFNLVATTEEQKADQALGLKAMFALWLFLFIGAVVYKLFDITFGKTDDTHDIGLLFFPILIAYSSLVPAIVKYKWKQLLPHIIIRTMFVSIALIALMRYWISLNL